MMKTSLKRLRGLLVPLALLASVFDTAAMAGEDPVSTRAPQGAAPTVVELFTSQGCSSCPPADALLGELAQRPNVVALSFHVTYWDRLGWPDPHATEWGTNRQRAYAHRMDLSYVYTPQMVVDGAIDVAGSRSGRVMAALEASERHAASRVAVGLDRQGNKLRVSLPQAREPLAGDAHLVLVSYLPHADNAVARGENAGRHLAHANVVRTLRDLGRWDGQPLTREVGLMADEAMAGRGLALLVQRQAASGAPGPILGAGLVN